MSDQLFRVDFTIHYYELFQRGFNYDVLMYLDVATFLSHLSDAEVLAGTLPLPLLIVLAYLIHFVHFLHHHKDCRKCGNSYHDSCGNKSFFERI